MIRSEDIAVAYAMDLAPRHLQGSRSLGLLPDRVYQEYRVYRSKLAVRPEPPPSPQLDLLAECVAC